MTRPTLKKIKYIAFYTHIYIYDRVRAFSEFLYSSLVPPPERSSDHCKFMWLREFAMLIWTGFSAASPSLFLFSLVWSELRCPLFTLGLLFLSLPLSIHWNSPVHCGPWEGGVPSTLSQGGPVSVFWGRCLSSPGGGWNVRSPPRWNEPSPDWCLKST